MIKRGRSKAEPSGRGVNLYNNSSHNLIKNTSNPSPNGIKPFDSSSRGELLDREGASAPRKSYELGPDLLLCQVI